jgi:hypothetical protein
MTPPPDFDDAVLGAGLPADVQAALQEAGAHRSDEPRAMAALMRARRLAPEHPAVLIALYRHHFYGHRWSIARDVARQALVAGAAALGLPALWREVPPEPLAGSATDPRTRFYLFALKGYAYLSLRLADPGDAADALALLRRLDPRDDVGGGVLESVRLRAERGAGDADPDEAPAAPRGWPTTDRTLEAAHG